MKEYELPLQGLPGLSNEAQHDDLKQLRHLLENYGINTSNTRIDRYDRYMQAASENDEKSMAKIFYGINGLEIDNDADRWSYLLREVHELNWIYRGLTIHRPKGIESKLEQIVSGQDFAALDGNSLSRNTQYELRIASYFCQLGYEVNLCTETDIIASFEHTTFYVECKRVSSGVMLERRVVEARKQIYRRMPKSRLGSRKKYFGVVCVDVTKIAFSRNGLTLGLTAEQTRDTIQNKLKEVSGKLNDEICFINRKHILMIWLQIHIPAIVIYPAQYTTRFSSLGTTNPKLGKKEKRAVLDLETVIGAGDSMDTRTVDAKKYKLRKGVTFPPGTGFKWDEPLIESYLCNCVLDIRDNEAIVLSLELNGDRIDFSYFELTMAFSLLNDEDHTRLRDDEILCRTELAARVYMIRNVYEEVDD